MMAINLETLVKEIGERWSQMPSRARSTHKIEHLAWFHGRKIGILTFVIQSCHEALQDIEGRQASHSAAVKRQQTEAGFIDLSRPLDADAVTAIQAAIDAYPVLVFRDQRLTDLQLRDFAARFGKLEIGRSAARPGLRCRNERSREIYLASQCLCNCGPVATPANAASWRQAACATMLSTGTRDRGENYG